MSINTLVCSQQIIKDTGNEMIISIVDKTETYVYVSHYNDLSFHSQVLAVQQQNTRSHHFSLTLIRKNTNNLIKEASYWNSAGSRKHSIKQVKSYILHHTCIPLAILTCLVPDDYQSDLINMFSISDTPHELEILREAAQSLFKATGADIEADTYKCIHSFLHKMYNDVGLACKYKLTIDDLSMRTQNFYQAFSKRMDSHKCYAG